MMVNFIFTLVRHGLTDANQNGIIQGQMDEPLNDLGRQQATILGQYLKNQLITHVFSSDLNRTKETAELILKSFSSRPGTILDERLRERKYGIVEGRSSVLLKELACKANKNLLDFTPEGGETLQELSKRVISFFKDLCISMFHQYDSLPPTPRQISVSRRASRTSILNPLLEEIVGNNEVVVVDSQKTTTNGVKSEGKLAKFYVDDPVVTNFCSSQDSGISGVFSSECLTVDTVAQYNQITQTSFPDSLSPSGCSSSSLSPFPLEWPPRATSPAYSSAPAVAARINDKRKVSMQSIASDDSNYPDIDAQVLVISHGGPIREMIRYLTEVLGVSMPGGKGAALRPCPNTGFSTFFVSLEDEAGEVTVTCLNLHSKDHLLDFNLNASASSEAI